MLHLLLITALPVASQIIADIPTFRKNTSGFRSLVLSVNSCECIFLKICLSVCFRLYIHTNPTSWLYTVKNLEEKTMKLPCLMWTSLLSK